MVAPLVLPHRNLVYLVRPGREQPRQGASSAGMWLAGATSNCSPCSSHRKLTNIHTKLTKLSLRSDIACFSCIITTNDGTACVQASVETLPGQEIFRFYSIKMRVGITVEPSLEFDACFHFEYSAEIVSFEAQPEV